MSDELKACGSCGLRDVECANVEFRGGPTSYYVFCNSCLTRSDYYDTESEALSAWNRRTVTQEQVVSAAKRSYPPTEWEWLDEGNRSLCITEAVSMFCAAGFEVAE